MHITSLSMNGRMIANNAIKMDWKTYNNSIPIFKEERFSNEIERIDKLI